MGTILCATRGGKESLHAQDAAIALAKEQGKRLIFTYIVDTQFLDRTARAVRPDVVAQEIAHMGEFLLTMAQERAQKAGIYADIRVCQGNFCPELKEVVRQEHVDILILGRPSGDDSAFKLAALEALADEIREDTGIEVRLV